MVFMLSCYLGIAMVNSKLDHYIALRYLKKIGLKPTRYTNIITDLSNCWTNYLPFLFRLLASLMILTFLLSSLIPDACACSIMIPITKAVIQILDEINVTNAIDDKVTLKDDE